MASSSILNLLRVRNYPAVSTPAMHDYQLSLPFHFTAFYAFATDCSSTELPEIKKAGIHVLPHAQAGNLRYELGEQKPKLVGFVWNRATFI
jgi:hypothetical protein